MLKRAVSKFLFDGLLLGSDSTEMDESLEEQGGRINHKGVKGAPPDSLISRFCLHALRFGTCNIRGTENIQFCIFNIAIFDTALFLFLKMFSM